MGTVAVIVLVIESAPPHLGSVHRCGHERRNNGGALGVGTARLLLSRLPLSLCVAVLNPSVLRRCAPNARGQRPGCEQRENPVRSSARFDDVVSQAAKPGKKSDSPTKVRLETLEYALRCTAKLLALRRVTPTSERDIQTVMHDHLDHVFPDYSRQSIDIYHVGLLLLHLAASCKLTRAAVLARRDPDRTPAGDGPLPGTTLQLRS